MGDNETQKYPCILYYGVGTTHEERLTDMSGEGWCMDLDNRNTNNYPIPCKILIKSGRCVYRRTSPYDGETK